jgi:prepilin-type N-terminal cleavage/methylation domain-containing protein
MMFSIRKLFKRDRFKSQHGDRKLGEQKFARTPSRTMRRMMQRSRGFTLIELLMAMLITTIIVGTLLSFVVNITETDRDEQAKSESQGEVQTALNYMADDLQEAVYIYNADTLGLDSPNGIKDQLPTFTNSTPVLVFWKRLYYEPTVQLNVDPTIPPNPSLKKRVGCLEFGTSTTETGCDDANGNPKGSGRYTYSLVAYYLIYNNQNGNETDDNNNKVPWSIAARIGRWELKDGIRHPTCTLSVIANCADPKPVQRVQVDAAATTFINYWTIPDPGFTPFDPSKGDLPTVMKIWQKTPTAYFPSPATSPYSPTKLTVLLDFVDDTPYTTLQDDGISGNSSADTANTKNTPNTPVAGTASTNVSCSDANIGVGKAGNEDISQRVPAEFKTTSSNLSETLSSFYVCVNSTQTSARIYLRGNALARLRPNQAETSRRASSTYLSTGNVRAYGRGKLFFQ